MSDNIKIEPSTSSPKLDVKMLATNHINIDDVDDFSKVCRACATVTDSVIPIFDGEGLQNNLAEKIEKHLPIEVRRWDSLPQCVCASCMHTVLAWHELVQCCRQADLALRRRAAAGGGQNPTFDLDKQYQRSDPTHESKSGMAQLNTFIKRVIVASCEMSACNEEDSDIKYVCDKCESHPTSSTIHELAEHLTTTHFLEICSEAAIERFIKDHIMFEESLLLDNFDIDTEDATIEAPVFLPNFCCPFCSSIFCTGSRLLCHLSQHMEVASDICFDCCNIVFNNKNSYVKHIQSTHVSTDLENLAVTCRSCGFTAGSKEDLQSHVTADHKDTNKKYRKNLERNSKYLKYIPAACPHCRKMFSNKYHMLFHLNTHNNNSRFHCNKCDKSYTSRGSLTAHKKVIHDGILKFLCSFCGEAFATRQTRDTHYLLHTNVKPFTCDYCSKSFRGKQTLTRHLEMHLDIRNYNCTLCRKKFRKKSHLNYHSRTHNKETVGTE